MTMPCRWSCPPRIVAACVLLACLALAACDAPQAPGAPASTGVPPIMADGDSLAWHGRQGCADCTAIQTRLQLRHAGDARVYALTEVYLAADGQRRFDEHGRWERRGQLLFLHADDGARRVYALLPDGRLQARDRHGRRVSPRDEGLLPLDASR